MKYIAWISDTHAGHRYGLLAPGTEIYEEGPEGELAPVVPELSPFQTFLWELYEEYIGRIAEIVGNAPLALLHSGDICHGDKHPEQLISTRKANQIIMGLGILKPWFALPNLEIMRTVVGTGSHNLGEGSIEYLIVELLKAHFPDLDIGFATHYLLELDGVAFDVAHHGPSAGIRHHTRGNQLRYYARSLVDDDVYQGNAPVRFILRGHYHTYRRETIYSQVMGQRFNTDIVLCPSWCGMSYYGQQATRSKPVTEYGVILIGVENGRVMLYNEDMITVMDRRRKESLWRP